MAKILALDDPKNQLFQDTPFKVWEVERHARLTSTKRKLKDKLGTSNWSLEDVAKDLAEVRERKKTQKESVKSRRQREGSMKNRVDEYLATFKDITPNDLQSITAMCNLELQMESIENELATSENLKVDDRKKLGELYAKLSTEHRQLQTALGIIRADRESEMDTAAEINRFKQGAKKKLEEEGIQIACPHCQEKMALNQGFVLFHFKANVRWKWESQCPNPKCKKWFVLKSDDFDVPESVGTVKELAPIPF